MVLMWRLLKREKLERVSGLEYLKLLLERLRAKREGQSADGRRADGGCRTSDVSLLGHAYRRRARPEPRLAAIAGLHDGREEDCYMWRRMYAAEGPIARPGNCWRIIQQRKPAHIIIALGGGVQERLRLSL
jgi:hypothetical protein